MVLASKEEQDAWKAKAQPVEQQKRQSAGRTAARARCGAKAKLEADLDALDDQMPPPLESIYSVKDDPQKASPIKVLFHGDYLNPVATVGVRPLGVLLPDGAPEAPIAGRRSRA